MYIYRIDTKTEEGVIKALFIDIFRFRILLALADTYWYTKGKKRLVPIWCSSKGLFLFKLAIKMGFMKNK